MAFQREDTLKKVCAIIAEKLKTPEESIKEDASFKDLGADSLDIVDMTMSFEDVFGIDINDEDAEKIRTVRDIVDHIHEARTK